MGFNVSVPPILLLMTAAATTSLHPSITPFGIFATAFLVQMAIALAEGKVTVFCVVVVPIYLASLVALPGTLSTSIAPTLALAFFIAMWRIGVCMSVCLHRYAAHAAFKCSPPMRFFLHVLGCAANQGGPIWWASQHRCHHKHCDLPRDPHSPIQDGVERAFAFFSVGHEDVEEEFAPKHNDTWLLRLLDTWSFAVCSAELYMAYRYFGREGLFVSYTSMWICQTGTLWFNIVNHPPDVHPDKACQASNSKGVATGWYPAFLFLDTVAPFFSAVASEAAHADHHVHFMLAKRDKYDCMYHSFVLPLEKMGLVWDVKVAPPE
mmetsp:Transcript_25695/g.55285  ORF Transcript_25695/g.55285 Transcript_25695/m.55285 type:complete len:321 (-) Transcript_25695:208-1170(-)